MLPLSKAKPCFHCPASVRSMEPMMIKEEHHQGDYSNNPWADINEYHPPHSHSPATEFHTYGFVPPAQQHGLPTDPYGRSVQSMYASPQPSQSLFTAQWPSMLTNLSSQLPPPMPAPPPPVTPVTTFATATPLPPLSTHQPTHTTTSRRTLTDHDRRRMCQYHEDNPAVKQTEIGGRSKPEPIIFAVRLIKCNSDVWR